jgi:two-component system NarL family response regulator
MKVLLVDDHALFVEGLRSLLEANHIEVVGTAGNGQEALEQVRQLRPDVVLMDINMPSVAGIEGARLIKTEFPQVKIVMLTMSTNDDDLFEALKLGASGYIVKDVKPSTFLELLSGVMRGEAAITREMATRIMDEFVRSERKGTETANTPAASSSKTPRAISELSSRQAEILHCVTEGYTYKEIAAKLAISERTVNYHMAEILNKLQLQNRAQVIAYATRHGLI